MGPLALSFSFGVSLVVLLPAALLDAYFHDEVHGKCMWKTAVGRNWSKFAPYSVL